MMKGNTLVCFNVLLKVETLSKLVHSVQQIFNEANRKNLPYCV